MKKLLLITGLLVAVVMTIAAQSVSYEYDASGNRIRRIMITLKNASSADEKDEEPIETGWGERKVTIFPNPTKGNLTIKIEGGEEETGYRYTLFNIGGQALKQGETYNKGNFPLSLNEYATGIYILILYSKDDKLTFKIVKE
jgi:hypothetical protein